MSRALFPVCASFGPMCLALAHVFPHREGFPYALIMAIPGALMVTAALNVLFRERTEPQQTPDRAAD